MAERTSEAVGSSTQTVTIEQVDGRAPQLSARFYSSDALEQIKVLDLTRLVAGPLSTMILGDLGAKIIKVEVPGTGDESRNWPPYLNNDNKEMTCYFVSLNRNKKSICVDFKSKDGIKVMHDLAKKCDVLVENFVPGKLENWGLGYDQLKKIAPHLIYCSLTGFGNKGPYKFRPGLDVIAASVGGLWQITGPYGGGPCKPGVAMTDIATGLYAHGAILAALLERAKTGKGQKIDCNLLSTQIAGLINIGSNYLNLNIEGKRYGTAHESIVPMQAFQTSDGYITIAAASNAQYVSLCKKLNVEELASDKRFTTNELRVRNRNILLDLLIPHFRKRTTAELMEMFEGGSFPYGPVNTIEQVFNDKHVKEIGLVKEMKTSRGTVVRMVGPPVSYSHTCNAVRLPPPYLGQHTREILTDELNYSETSIKKLYEAKVIQ